VKEISDDKFKIFMKNTKRLMKVLKKVNFGDFLE